MGKNRIHNLNEDIHTAYKMEVKFECLRDEILNK